MDNDPETSALVVCDGGTKSVAEDVVIPWMVLVVSGLIVIDVFYSVAFGALSESAVLSFARKSSLVAWSEVISLIDMDKEDELPLALLVTMSRIEHF